MFARSAGVVGRPAAGRLAAAVAQPNATRSMATLREIEARLKSIKNIEKITKTMKTVASTKLTRAQRAMESAKVYGAGSNRLYDSAETKLPEEGKTLFVTVSSDKGLCGGVHSQMSRATRRAIDELANAESKVVVLGDKARAQLVRLVPSNLALAFNNVGRDVPTYAEAQAIADMIIKEGLDFDKIKILYNKFESAMSYSPATIEAYSEEAFKNSINFGQYEIEDDVLQNLREFTLANNIYWGLVEGHACEISARRNAMDSASKNAGEMIDKFSILYNRQRQAVITNELIDIITGASAL